VDTADTDKLVADKCYRCAAPLQGAARCPQCGRKQYRTCFCGHQIPITTAICPYCGADWSSSRRVRRKSHPRKLNYKEMAQFGAVGVVVTLVAGSLVNMIITGLAHRSVSGQPVPASFVGRVVLALQTVGHSIAYFFGQIVQMSGSIASVLLLVIIGAGAGAVVYLIRGGFIRLRRKISTHKRKRRT